MTQLMRGQALTLSYERGRRCWSLSGGQPVSDEIAKIVIQDHRVIGTGDALFRNMPAQTFRFIED
jgi:hypothetical protein